MRKNRTLALKRETLAQLTATEMESVHGGSHLCGPTDDCTHASFDAPCPTTPVLICINTVLCVTTEQ